MTRPASIPLTDLQEKLQKVNEALVLGSLRQHELTETAENLNALLHIEMTERRVAETALRKTEGIYHELFNGIDEGFCIIEKVANGPLSDYRYIDVNPAFDSQSGLQDVIGKTIRELLPNEPEGWCGVYDTVLATGAPIRFERDLASRNRSLELFAFRVEDDTRRRVAVLFTDTTRRKLEEKVKNRLAVLTASNSRMEREISRRKIVEKELISSEKKEKDLRARTRQLARQVLNSREEERLRISRELHDQVVQALIGINTHLIGLRRSASKSGPDFLRQLNFAQSLVEESVESVHKLAWDLRPDTLDILGFLASLRALLKEFLTETGVRTELTIFAGADKLEEPLRTTLYRVIQEALTNVTRHAEASLVNIRILKKGDSILMEIEDNGKGFKRKPPTKHKQSGRLGLIGMEERIEMVDGTFTIASDLGKGTIVKVLVPLTVAANSARTLGKETRPKRKSP